MIEASQTDARAMAPIPDLEILASYPLATPDAQDVLGRRVMRQTDFPAVMHPMPWFALHEPRRIGASLHEVVNDQPDVGIRAGQYVLIENGYVPAGAAGFDDDQLLYASALLGESGFGAIIAQAGALKACNADSYQVRGVVRAVFDRTL